MPTRKKSAPDAPPRAGDAPEARAILEDWLRSSNRWMELEAKRAPGTFWQYAPDKEHWFCDPFTWAGVEQSAQDALVNLTGATLGVDKWREGMTGVQESKASAIMAARLGQDIDASAPGLLAQAVREGWLDFLADLHAAHGTGAKAWQRGLWRPMACELWAGGAVKTTLKRPMYWPLAFWSDDAARDLLNALGAPLPGQSARLWDEISVKQWRTFRERAGLVRAPFLIVREFSECLNPEGDLRGFNVAYRPKKTPGR